MLATLHDGVRVRVATSPASLSKNSCSLSGWRPETQVTAYSLSREFSSFLTAGRRAASRRQKTEESRCRHRSSRPARSWLQGRAGQRGRTR